MKPCVINFADGDFIKGQERLKQSLKKLNIDVDILFFNSIPEGCPTHEKVPWGFKVYAFEKAFRDGYRMIIWIDSAGIVIKSLDNIIKEATKNGVFLFSRYNSSVGETSSDYFLDINNLNREKAFSIPEISAFCIAINFNNESGTKFFKEWKKMADDGISFLGLPNPYTIKDSMLNKNHILSKDNRVLCHRHDQTAASVAAYKIGILPQNRYIFDLTCEAKKGDPYAKYIPLGTIILQNRDIKTANYTGVINYYWNYKGIKKIIYILGASYYSIIRKIKDLIKWNLFYKCKYKKND